MEPISPPSKSQGHEYGAVHHQNLTCISLHVLFLSQHVSVELLLHYSTSMVSMHRIGRALFSSAGSVRCFRH